MTGVNMRYEDGEEIYVKGTYHRDLDEDGNERDFVTVGPNIVLYVGNLPDVKYTSVYEPGEN